MKIIDEKGKLFGKINLIDFLALLFILALIPAFYFGYAMFTKKTPLEPKEVIDVELFCKFIKVKPRILKQIKVGDEELDTVGNQIAQIVWLGDVGPYKYQFDLGNGNIVTKLDPILKEITARIKLKVSIEESVLIFKNARLINNSPISFSTDKYNLAVVPCLSEKRGGRLEKIELSFNLKGLTENELKLISVGDKEIDEKGEVIAEILSVGKIDNDALEIDLGGGNFISGENSGKKQVNVQMRLLCGIGENKQIYFKGLRLEDDSFIKFKTDKYAVMAKVAKTYESILSFKEKWVQVKVRFSGVLPELTKIINEGDIEKEPITGKVVAILNKIIDSGYSEVLVFKENKLIAVKHPFEKAFIINLNLLCIEKGGVLYFENYPVKVGNTINFSTDIYSLNGVIIGLENR